LIPQIDPIAGVVSFVAYLISCRLLLPLFSYFTKSGRLQVQDLATLRGYAGSRTLFPTLLSTSPTVQGITLTNLSSINLLSISLGDPVP
jgi:hypothetical protein